MKKFLSVFLCTVILTAAFATCSLAAEKVTVYSSDGSVAFVDETEVAAYLNAGWQKEPFIGLYTADGRSMVVPQSQAQTYSDMGWYVAEYKSVQLFNEEGNSFWVAPSEAANYTSQGWYMMQVRRIYTAWGDSMVVAESDVESYVALGWYPTKNAAQTTIYAPDGTIATVFNAYVDQYVAQGWSTSVGADLYYYGTNVPNYTYVTGSPMAGSYDENGNLVYRYNYDYALFDKYSNYLLTNGWTTLDVEVTDAKYELCFIDAAFKRVVVMRINWGSPAYLDIYCIEP